MPQHVNGHAATAGAATPAAALTTAVSSSHHNNHDGTSFDLVPTIPADVARFMPVMPIEQALQRRQMIVDATARLMKEGVDFGTIPGAGDRSTLLQPGADKLCNLFGLVIQYEVIKSIEDWTGEEHGGTPFFFYEIKGRAYRGEFLMGEGIGSCSSWESKYRWRRAERACPSCGKAAIRKSRDAGGGWFCWRRLDGCGATFKDGDSSIEHQEVGRKVNPDMADCVNTILKMAYKRCKVSTTINATSASEFFTQDVEDAPVDDDPHGRNVDIGNAAYGTREAQQSVAARKIDELKAKKGLPIPSELPTAKSGEIRDLFAKLREILGEVAYLEEMQIAGVRGPFDLGTLDKIRALYARMCQRAIAQQEAA
jgi:ribosomal protein L37AE/L43A